MHADSHILDTGGHTQTVSVNDAAVVLNRTRLTNAVQRLAENEFSPRDEEYKNNGMIVASGPDSIAILQVRRRSC